MRIDKSFSPAGIFFLALVLTAVLPHLARAWPGDGDWIPIYNGSDMLSDLEDSAGSRDIVGDAASAAAYLFNDGNYIYFRLRLDADPRDNSGVALSPFGWGFLLDLNQNLDDYEYMIMLDGISSPETMYLARNTQQGTIGDPSDKAELIIWQETLNYGNNFRALGPLDSGGPTTSFGGDDDFFLDYFIPYDVFKNSMGLTDDSLIRYFVGSSNSAQTLSADLVGGSTLYDGSSNYVMPSGTQPTTGSVYFVGDAAGATDLTEFYAGGTVYLKVIDADLNSAATSRQTVTVTVTAPSGDSHSVTLTETGVDTGIFITPFATSDGAPVAGDAILQVSPIEIITVTYLDAADGTEPTPLKNQARTDTARALPAADIAVSKSVGNGTPNEGETVVYTVRAANNGPSNASGIQVTDLLPAGVTYVSHIAPAGSSYNPGTGLWTAGDLTKDAFKELSISAIVDAGTAQTTITNTASRTAASQPDPDSDNDNASVAISVTGADLGITKSADNLTPAVGSTVTFTITVVNNGTYDATNVEITDLLPTATWSGVAVTSITQGSWNYVGGTGIWTVGGLPYPGSATLVLSATLDGAVAGGSTVVNTVGITSVDQSDPQPGNDSAEVSLVVGGIDLSLDKEVTSPLSATPDEGDQVEFTVTVSNSAAASTTATGVEVTDLLPAGLTFAAALPSQGSYSQGNGKWSGISLAPGAGASLVLTATVMSGTAGQTITNTANITGYNEVDVDTANHGATAGITIRAIDLQITKTVSDPAPANNDPVSYTVTVTNLGSITATVVSIFDQLPGQVTFTSADTGGNGSYSSATHLWSGITLAPGAGATLTINVTVNLGAQDPKTFFNTASLNGSTPGDSNATNDVASAVISVNGTDLGLSKTMQTGYTDYPAGGDTSKFLITLTNDGPNPATNIKVIDLYPAGLSCNAATTVSTGSFTNNGAKCDWTVPSLAVGASATMVLDSTVSAADGSTVTNRVTIDSADQSDPNVANNTAGKTIYVGASDLEVSMTVDNPAPNVGDTVMFTITVINNGSNSVSGIEVTDLLPTGVTYSSHAASNGAASYDPPTGVWTVGDLSYAAGPPEAKGTATLELYATVDAGTSGTVIANEAVISANPALDPNSANDLASASIAVQQADVYVNKGADALTPYVGETVTFTITAGNNGPNGVTGLVVRDLLAVKPDDPETTPAPVFTDLAATPSQGSYDSITGDWSVGALAKNATATLTITATLAAGSEGKNITNSAGKLSADQSDSNVSNDSGTIIITPRLLLIDLELTKTVDDGAPVEGNNVVFTLTLYNLHGSRNGDNLQVTDLLPADFTYVSAVPSQGTYDSATGIWEIGTVGPMSNATLALTAKTACGSGGSTLTNDAGITAADQDDPDTANNSAGVDVAPIDASPSLMVLKSANAPAVSPGDVVLYTVQVRNTGCGKATNVDLDDHMSPYTAWQLDYNSDGGPDEPFNFAAQTSGLTLGAPDYSRDGGATWGAAPVSEGGGMPAGYDGTITNWRIPMIGEMVTGGQFTLRYKAMVR
jgi:uncharacterized repeat protein (TIGR01451 family)